MLVWYWPTYVAHIKKWPNSLYYIIFFRIESICDPVLQRHLNATYAAHFCSWDFFLADV